MKNSADLGECYSPRPLASVVNTLLDLQNSSYPTQPHSIIAKYYCCELYKFNTMTTARLLSTVTFSLDQFLSAIYY